MRGSFLYAVVSIDLLYFWKTNKTMRLNFKKGDFCMINFIKMLWASLKQVFSQKDTLFFHYIYSLFKAYFGCFYCIFLMQNKINIIFGVVVGLYFIVYELKCFIDFYNNDLMKNGKERIKSLSFVKENKKFIAIEFIVGICWVATLTVASRMLMYMSVALGNNGNGMLYSLLAFFVALALSAFIVVENTYSIFKKLTNEKYKRNGTTRKLFELWKFYFITYYITVVMTLIPIILIILGNLPVYYLIICLFIFAFFSGVFHDTVCTNVLQLKYMRDQTSLGRKTKAIQLAEAKRFSIDNLLGFGGSKSIEENSRKKKIWKTKRM